VSRVCVDLVDRGAGHQASLFSTDRPHVLRETSLEDSSEGGTIRQAVVADRSVTLVRVGLLAARRLRRGRVFADRYHVEVITTPTRARHALGYVLSNWRKHGEDREGLASTWLVDPFSTGILFPDWKELQEQPWMWPIRETYDPLMVRRPQSWLLREGWKKAGGPISARDVPSKAR
jgi:hypothetical protein